MERLTERDGSGRAYLVTPPVPRGGVFRGKAQQTMQKAIERLAAYEDRGAEPEEITQRRGKLWEDEEMDWRTQVVRLLRKQSENKDVCAVLESMSEEDRLILERCYIHRKQGAAERLAAEMKLTLSEVFRRRDRALRRFAMAMCEAVELSQKEGGEV